MKKVLITIYQLIDGADKSTASYGMVQYFGRIEHFCTTKMEGSFHQENEVEIVTQFATQLELQYYNEKRKGPEAEFLKPLFDDKIIKVSYTKMIDVTV